MKLIMPMAGRAQRFNQKSDELIIKPLIEVEGKPLFQWALTSFQIPVSVIFIIQRAHQELKNKILELLPDSEIIELDGFTRGPVETLTHCFDLLDKDGPVIVCDCDLYFESPAFMEFLQEESSSIDSGVLTFPSQSPSYSYVEIDGDKVIKIKEKEVISSQAVCGSYYFKSSTKLITYSESALEKYSNREIFMSDVIRVSLERGDWVRAFKTDYHISLGTPEEISQNQNKLPRN